MQSVPCTRSFWPPQVFETNIRSFVELFDESKIGHKMHFALYLRIAISAKKALSQAGAHRFGSKTTAPWRLQEHLGEFFFGFKWTQNTQRVGQIGPI